MKTHFDTSKSVSFEVQQSMKQSYEAMSEQTLLMYESFTLKLFENLYEQRIS